MYRYCIKLTHLFAMHPLSTPENIRKPPIVFIAKSLYSYTNYFTNVFTNALVFSNDKYVSVLLNTLYL